MNKPHIHAAIEARKPHVHADTIKAWADGAEIEVSLDQKEWNPTTCPTWNEHKFYRVKPDPVVRELVCVPECFGYFDETGKPANLRLTFEDRKLVKAEVI